MKHLKQYERKNLKEYKKYTQEAELFLKEEFTKNIEYVNCNIEYLTIYEEFDEICMSIKIWYSVNNNFFDIMKKLIDYTKYTIDPNNGNQLTVNFNITNKNFFEILDQRLAVNKYNL